MDSLIKNIDEENWHFLKVMAAEEKVTLGRLFNMMVNDYKRRKKEEVGKAWQKIFSREPLLKKEEKKLMQESVEEFCREFSFEG